MSMLATLEDSEQTEERFGYPFYIIDHDPVIKIIEIKGISKEKRIIHVHLLGKEGRAIFYENTSESDPQLNKIIDICKLVLSGKIIWNEKKTNLDPFR